MYKGIDGKTGYKNIKGNDFTYGDMRLLSYDERQSALADGVTEYTPPARPQPTEAELLANAKLSKRAQIRSGYDYFNSLPVVDSNGVEWVGGFDSAIKLDAAKRLAETFGATEVTLYSYPNQPYVLSLADALAVIGLVANSYQTALATKNSLYNDVDNATDLAGVEAVVIPAEWVSTEV